jgi:hypothetical protein
VLPGNRENFSPDNESVLERVMIYRKMRSIPAVIAEIFLIAAAGWGAVPAGAGGGSPGHGHGKAEKGYVEKKGHGAMPMSGGHMKMAATAIRAATRKRAATAPLR